MIMARGLMKGAGRARTALEKRLAEYADDVTFESAGAISSGVSCVPRRRLSDSITYSGGQASEGQGGFYGSGGARVVSNKPAHHPEALAQQVDVATLTKIMQEVTELESELLTLGSAVTSRSIEIKSKIKKTISNPRVRELLSRLEIKGEPVWGLSREERLLVRKAKDKYLSS